jgi:hypothetical protein
MTAAIECDAFHFADGGSQDSAGRGRIRSAPPNKWRPLEMPRYRGVFVDMGWSPCAEIGGGSTISALVSKALFWCLVFH